MQPHNEPAFDARLLVAEDNSVNQDIAARVLEQLGCRVVIAENGAVAERLLAREKFDLVLMDCEMPELDGYALTRRVRQSEQRAAGHAGGGRMPIVALTAHASEEAREKCAAAGMDEVIAKPFNRKQMRETLRRWIGDLEKPVAFQADMPLAAIPSPEDSPVDRAVWNDILEAKGTAGVALLKRLLQRFAETAPGAVASLRREYQAGRLEELWRLAHGLRSGAAALGIRHVSRRLADIEKRARDRRPDGLASALIALESDLAAALESLESVAGELDERA